MQSKAFSPTVLLIFILFCGFFVRLYRFSGPIADWHSWRQADTSAVSRTFAAEGFDVLHPRFEDLSNVPSGLENPKGYRFVEFPLYNIFQAGLFKSIGIMTLEEWGRLVTIFSSLATALFLFCIVKKRVGITAGLLTAGFFIFLPYNIYYGRTILPDPSMSMAITGGIYFFDLWVGKKLINKNSTPIQSGSKIKIGTGKYLIFSLFFTMVALLLKPYAIIFSLPMVYLAYEKFGFGVWKKWQLYIFAIFAVMPLILWRLWMRQYPEGIPVSNWLLNGDGIRFRPAFFRWIIFERVTKLISGYAGVLLIVYGVWQIVRKKDWFFLSFVIASFLYVCIFATGNVKHDYYQILIMPSVAILMGLGSYYFLQLKFIRPMTIRYLLFVVCCVMLFFLSWSQVKDYFNINNPAIVSAGQAADKMTPKNAKVIANLEGDTSFLYQTKRQGWPSFEHDMPVMIKLGADYLVLANPKESDLAFGKTYKIISQTPQYILFDLHKNP